MDLIILYNKISAGIESLISKHQIQNSQLKIGDKGQKTKDLMVRRNKITAGIESLNLRSNQIQNSQRNQILNNLNGNILRPKRPEKLREDR